MPTEPHDPGAEHVEGLYDGDVGHEWERLERHRTELAVTLRILREHLPPPPARVLDCGGGPGRYAIELTRLGYEVTLFDLSAENLRTARTKAAEAGVTIARFEHGTATDLSRFSKERFDAVLLMGPLYHLLELENRRSALEEARRVLTPSGRLFAAFIARYAPLRYAAKAEVTWPTDSPEQVERVLETGVLPPRGEPGSGFVAHFAHPLEIEPLLWETGFEPTGLWGVEGLVSMIEEGVSDLQGQAWDTWTDLNYRVSSDPSLHGGVEHLLALAEKPRWRTVLHRIVQTLDEAGIAYQVVGGAVAALHGVRIPVADIDIRMEVEDTYHFQELFAEQVTRPVALSASESYRSHFGQFDFGGVQVEVMGDLHRREGDQWVPSAAHTETSVDLEGTRVRTHWLEEGVLAYIRRGRLERAAQCLPHCDHARLVALLRGEQSTDVI